MSERCATFRPEQHDVCYFAALVSMLFAGCRISGWPRYTSPETTVSPTSGSARTTRCAGEIRQYKAMRVSWLQVSRLSYQVARYSQIFLPQPQTGATVEFTAIFIEGPHETLTSPTPHPKNEILSEARSTSRWNFTNRGILRKRVNLVFLRLLTRTLGASYLIRTLTSAKIKLYPDKIPWSKYTKTSFFETRLAFLLFWVKEPRHSEGLLAEMCYFYGRTRQSSSTLMAFDDNRLRSSGGQKYF